MLAKYASLVSSASEGAVTRPADAMDHPRLQLMDWKRRVLAMYAARARGRRRPAACAAFRAARDELFRDPPPVPCRPRPGGASAAAVLPPTGPTCASRPRSSPTDGRRAVIPMSTGEPARFTRIGRVRPALGGAQVSLAVYWLEGYGGGLFLPFRDALAARRPTAAGATCSTPSRAPTSARPRRRGLVLDFNYAYNPSCAYDPRWSCPLAPPENRLDVAVEAGERMVPGT